MSALDLAAIRTALAERAIRADGVKRALAFTPNKVNATDLPLVCVGNPEPITFNRTFGGGRATLTLRLTCLVSVALDPEKATALLDEFLLAASDTESSTSLAAVLRLAQSTEDEPWLFNVKTADGYGLYKFESTEFYGVQLVVDVTT